MNRAKYPKRDALRQAHDIYLDAMCLFVSNCLDDGIKGKIEISDVAHLVRTYWRDYFEEQFKVVDPHYEARSAIGLIVEGRNRASHPPWDLDPEFTRTQLFLIAEVLGKINRADAQREVEIIRDKLFKDTTEQRVIKGMETEKAKYEKSIAEVEKRLRAAEESKKKLSKQIIDNAVKLDEKTEELKKLSEQLMGAKLSEREKEKQRNSISKQLKKVQTAHNGCEERITTISNQLTAAERERDDYKERFETATKEREEAKTGWRECADSLTALRELFTVATIGNQTVQAVYPPIQTDSTVRILDRRGVGKRNFLLDMLNQKQPTIIYVQCEEMADLLLKRVVPEKADVIGEHNERTSEAEERAILEKLQSGELIAVVSSTAFSILDSSHCIEHFVFCHLIPSLDEFFERCQPAFTSKKDTYLHLIYNSEHDINGLNKWLTQKYPARETLINLHRSLKGLVGVNGDFIKFENLYDKLDIERLQITKLGLETGFAIFEELKLLERNDEGIRLLPSSGRKLEEASEIYRQGQKLRTEKKGFCDFQQRSIEQIWEEILKKLNVDSERILHRNNIHPPKMEVDIRATNVSGRNQIVSSTLDWPQRRMNAFNALRERAARNPDDTNSSWLSKDRGTTPSPFGGRVESPMAVDNRKNNEDYENKYNLATLFIQEHGIDTLEEGVGQLIKDQGDPNYNFTEDERDMLGAFEDALRDFRRQSEQSADAVEDDNTVDNEGAEAKPTRANAKVTEEQVSEIRSRSTIAERYVTETTEEDRNSLAVQIAEMRINATGSRPIAWKTIRGKFGLKEDEFHKVIRPSPGYREAVINRIKTLKSRDEGWEYSGKLENLTGIEISESELS